jgi:hypothetical protein
LGEKSAVNRRDFLILRSARSRAAEISCQRLYLWCMDVTALTDAHQERCASGGEEPVGWTGEPPAVFEPRTLTQVFQELERDLRDVDVVRVRDTRWRLNEDVSMKLETLLAEFRRRGGRVEYLD